MAKAKGLYSRFSNCKKEEEIKSEFCKFFKTKLNAVKGIDHYTDNVLFEFKYDKNFKLRQNIAIVLAQTMYYVRWLKFSDTTLKIPRYICVVDKNEAFFVETKDFKTIYASNNATFDWDRAASTPCQKIIASIEKLEVLNRIKLYDLTQNTEENLFIEKCKYLLTSQLALDFLEKKVISEENFLEVFEYWNNKFGNYVKNGRKSSEYFLADIEQGHSIQQSNGEILFDVGNNTYIKKNVPQSDYEKFWQSYDHVAPAQMALIRQKSDRITENFRRKFEGDYYTPIPFAKKGLEYLERELGKNWWMSGEYRFWDMAAGTGNLEFNIPTSALQYCYISTLVEEEAEYCKKIFPAATCFQYDYLNDDIINLDGTLKLSYKKLPRNLKADLENPKIKWIVFINPPFKTANNKENKVGKKSHDTVSMTYLHEIMASAGYGEASRELFIQFLYRISFEFKKLNTYLCLYSTLKYLNSNNDQKIRDTFFQYKFCRGFLFPSKCFYGHTGNFPVGFLIWHLAKEKHLSDQPIELDVFNENTEKIGTKTVPSRNRKDMLNKWVPRPRWDKQSVMPMFSSALKQQTENKDKRDHIAKDFLMSLVSPSDDVQHQNNVCILSAPYANAGAFSVVPANFERAMVLFSAKMLITATWTNNRDAFYAPNRPLSQEFINDCVIFAAFHKQNYTVSLKDIPYKSKLYRIINNLYPYQIDEVREWECSNSDIAGQMIVENQDRYLAVWLQSKQISQEAQSVLGAAKKVYEYFYKHLSETDWFKYHIKCWDVGLYQVLKALEEKFLAKEEIEVLKSSEEALGKKLRPSIYEYGIMSRDVVFFH